MKTTRLRKSTRSDSSTHRVATRRKHFEEQEECRRFLNLRLIPAGLNVQRAAWLLGFRPHEIQILSFYGLLKPLGAPAMNALKFYSTAYVRRLMNDLAWMDLAVATLQEHWKKKNLRPTKSDSSGMRE
jgi:hypothetical protein